MKPTTKEEMTGYVKALIHLYHENQNRIEEDKHLSVMVIEFDDCWKIFLEFATEIKDGDATTTWDYFTWKKGENLNKLERYVNDCLDTVTANPVIVTNKKVA